MAVLAARLLQPKPTVTHEIAEASGLAILRRGKEREITRSQAIQVLPRRLAAQLIQQIAQDESARVVIGAVAIDGSPAR